MYFGFYYNSEERDFGKEVIILKSSLTKELYRDFVSSYQVCHQNPSNHLNHQKPYVYVNNDGSIKLITNVVNSIGGEDEIFALSIAEDGFVEFLAFQE